MRYVLRYPDGKFVALDSASGGYPYAVDDVFRARLWDTREAAERYNAVFSWKDYDNPVFSLAVVSTLVEGVTARKGSALAALRFFRS